MRLRSRSTKARALLSTRVSTSSGLLSDASPAVQTNNPRKIKHLEDLGVKVVERIPCLVTPGEYSKDYLQVKEERMDHMLNGDFCHWNHGGELEPAHPPAPVDELEIL